MSIKRRRKWLELFIARLPLFSAPVTAVLAILLTPLFVACSSEGSEKFDEALLKLSQTEDLLMGSIGAEWIPRSKPTLVTCQVDSAMRQIWSKHTGTTDLAPASSIESTRAILEAQGFKIKNLYEWPGITAGNDSVMLEAIDGRGSYFKVESFADGYIAIFALSNCI